MMVPYIPEPIWGRVVAFNAGGEANPSMPAWTTPPAAPSDLTVTALDDLAYQLTWRDNSAVEETYEVRGEWHDIPACSPGACSAVVYPYNWKIAELPANSTTYRSTGCVDFGGLQFAGLYCAGEEGRFAASAEWWR